MASGFICCLAQIDTRSPHAYFDGYAFSESIDAAKIYPSRADAKLATTQLQSVYTDSDLIYLPAQQTVVLTTGNPSPPPTIQDSTPTTIQ